MNLKDCTWDTRLLKIFDLDREKLCELKAPGSIVGYTTTKFSEETGLQEGIPVISAGGDQQCGMLGQGVVEQGNVSLTLGTGGFLLTTCESVPEHLDWDVVCNASSDAGKYILEANMLTCTSAMEWFHHKLYEEKTDFYGRLNEILQEIPAGARGCRALPYFQGRSTPDWNSGATAGFYGITLNTSKEDMLKALLEGICMEICNNINSFEKYIPVGKIMINGGLTKSEAFNQMQAEVYGKTVIRMDNTESTAIGALMVAAVTMKQYPDVKEAFLQIHKNSKAKEYHFHTEIHRIYEELQQQMNKMYQKIEIE
jgi:sugar (pentulose or hexulose) kinase